MSRATKTIIGGALAAGLALVGTTFLAPVASAVDKAMTVNPATGTKNTALNLVTAGQCSSGDKIQVFVTGNGFPANGYGMTGKDSVSSKIQGANYNMPLLESLNDAAAAQTPAATLSGAYTFTAKCYQGLGSTVLDTFKTAIVFDGANFGAAAVTASLSAIPAQIAPGRAVNITANLAAVYGTVPAGSIEFFDFETSLGASQVAAGAATASISKSDFAAGNHEVKATFTPTNTAYSPVTTAVWNFEIAVPATGVVLATSPQSPAAQYSLVSITATVFPSDAVGTVDFFDGGTKIGTGVVRAGIASITKSDFSVQTHALTATFTPTNVNDFGASSTVDPLSFEVTPRTGPAPASQTLQAQVDATGALTISLAPGEDGVVSFGTLALNSTADRLIAAGAMDSISISDTRFNNPGWELTAQATPFVGASSQAQVPAAYIGLVPTVMLASGNQQTDRGKSDYVAAGASATPADPTSGTPATSGGIQGKVTIASAAAGWRGLAKVGATLALEFPVSTTPDSYVSTLTLTVS